MSLGGGNEPSISLHIPGHALIAYLLFAGSLKHGRFLLWRSDKDRICAQASAKYSRNSTRARLTGPGLYIRSHRPQNRQVAAAFTYEGTRIRNSVRRISPSSAKWVWRVDSYRELGYSLQFQGAVLAPRWVCPGSAGRFRGQRSSGPVARTEFVEQLVNEIRVVTNRNNYSLAAKYVHFFVDSSLLILDSFAEWCLRAHLGQEIQSKDPRRYHRFVEDIATLKRAAGLTFDCAELDAYLWVAGEYWY